jgi:membrane-associated PAP2 superfamily phosphatase
LSEWCSGRIGSVRGRDVRAFLCAVPVVSMYDDARLLRTHLWPPLAVFALLIPIMALLHLDWTLAQQLYTLEGSRWALKNAFLTQTLLHRAGHDLSIAAWVMALVAWWVALTREPLREYRRPLCYLVLSVVVSTALVAWIKSWSNMDCAWDVAGLGGTRPYIDLFTQRPASLPHGGCFPAGHASSGFAWMALYFFFRITRPELRWHGLAIGIAVGSIFGIAQQLRGAHFLSHDLWSAMLCWLVAIGLYRALRPLTDKVVAAD